MAIDLSLPLCLSLSLSLWSLVFLCLSALHCLTKLLEAMRKWGPRALDPPSSIPLMIFTKSYEEIGPESSGSSLLYFPCGCLLRSMR